LSGREASRTGAASPADPDALEVAFERASPQQRADFEQLLELPDPELERYLVWGVPPEEPERAALVQAIRGLRPEDYVQQHANLSAGHVV